MDFSYNLVGVGWAEAIIVGSTRVTITASYLTDALRDLLSAVASLLDGADSAKCSWEEEPGEYRWTFTNNAERVELVILRLRHAFPEMPDDQGVVKFRHVEPLISMARTIADEAQRLLDFHGEEGYQRLWSEAPFPVDLLRQIQTRLNTAG